MSGTIKKLPPHILSQWSGITLVVTLPVLWILAETIRRDEPRGHRDSLDFAASDLIKSVLSLSIWFVCRRFQSSPCCAPSIPLDTCEQGQEFPISNSHSHWQGPHRNLVTLTLGNVRSILCTLLVGFVHALRAYTDLRALESVDPFSLYLTFPVTVLGVLVFFQLIPWRNFSSPLWHGAVLQFAGFFIVRDALVGSAPPAYTILVAFALCDSIFLTLVDVCDVRTVVPPTFLVIYVTSITWQLAFVSCIVAICIIHQYGAINQGILTALASTILITVDMGKFTGTPHSAFLGCLIAIMGSGIFVLRRQHKDEQPRHDLSVSSGRRFAATIISVVVLGHVIIVTSGSRDAESNSSELSSNSGKISSLSAGRLDCHSPEPSTLTHTQTISNYTNFSNILLIVFFSHARYDANLDFHKEVYADYFPNIVYIGPATREDKGFAHSYDVLVDSFQSEEDLNDPRYYRMAGRMAHHMLYTALREYDCYDGYLWVPFDTLLNVPRLQQFNQSLFWYHSPWGQPVPNPVLGDFTESGLNMTRHAPAAMISPDPSVDLTATWRGWGPDWWWGDPHVGVSICMNAFRKVPAVMRDHLAERNHGQTRLIGGSADTLYIPGRHRKAFMDVLALFLETDCFFEIATPTTVHLVVPPWEPIQFVDHWWIWQPPFNASFVRQKWEEGFEVDTFHTFHWGERGEDGVWLGDHRHVGDVRHLLRESAHRQGLGDVFPVNLSNEMGDDRPLN